MEFHEYANLFPLLDDAEIARLGADIRARGQEVPIMLHEGKILDGRNRYRACMVAEVEPRTEEYRGTDPLGYVVSHNLHRRHLTESQRGMVAAKLADLRKGAPIGNANAAKTNPPIGGFVSDTQTRNEAAGQLSVGTSTVDRAKKVRRDGVDVLVKAVEAGEVSVNAAWLVSNLPAEEQAALVEEGPAAVKAKAKEIRTAGEPAKAKAMGTGEEPPKCQATAATEAEDLWLLAWTHFEKIRQCDPLREKILRQAADYIAKRLQENR
jgi:ParB-like chromosome segregation protein Spo0J